MLQKNLRNVAIVAHVDHGKTTLVDAMLRQAGVFRENEAVPERVLDSFDLERERGITIFAKNAAVRWKGVKINLIDTPGHADFGGEVERVLSMADGILLLVDAAEGPLPQTKFVLRKSMERSLPAVVAVNKIDRQDARPEEVVDEILDLFLELGADESQIEYPVLFAIAREGKAGRKLPLERNDLSELFETLIQTIPPPKGEVEAPFQLLVSQTGYDPYLGKTALGRVHRGVLKNTTPLVRLQPGGEKQPVSVVKLFIFEGLRRQEAESAPAGEIVLLTGMEAVDIGDTLADAAAPEALAPIQIEEPTLSMVFSPNTSPFSGKEGKFVTSRHLRERLFHEARANPALRVEEIGSPDALKVSGRGELHLGILIETLRREGYEFQVSRPQFILKENDGKLQEPYETLILDVPTPFVGTVLERVGARKGEMKNMHPLSSTLTRLEFSIPARFLMGFRTEFLTETKGEGILHRVFAGYGEFRGEEPSRSRGVLVAMESGTSTAYALYQLQDRGVFFIEPRTPVYEGMIVGEHTRENDLAVNVCKEKHLTNMRSKSADEALTLEPPRRFSLEQCLEYIQSDELLEVTPTALRMRKKILNTQERQKAWKEQQRVLEKSTGGQA